MPMHDWTKVDAGIYHALHMDWIAQINRAMKRRLPEGYYSLPEQRTGHFGPDVLTLATESTPGWHSNGGTATLARPRTQVVQESVGDFYRRKQNLVAIRHVSGNRLVAVIELVSPGNKDSKGRYRAFVRKARELLERGIHLLIVDPFAPPAKYPNGLHFDIVGEDFDDPYRAPPGKPLSAISYECDENMRAFVEPFAVGDSLIDMPVYLVPEQYVEVPLEATYMAAWDSIPTVLQKVVEG